MVKGASSTQYGLVRDYSGSRFFDGWSFYGSCALLLFFSSSLLFYAEQRDLVDNVTNGDAMYVVHSILAPLCNRFGQFCGQGEFVGPGVCRSEFRACYIEGGQYLVCAF